MTTAIERYPAAVALGGSAVTLRPLRRGDEQALTAFFRRLPVDERRMLKDDVTNPLVIASWCSNLDYDRVLPLLALEGERILGDATLHRSPGGWSQHVAKIRVTVDPDWRRRGVGRLLVRELLDIAEKQKIALVDAEVMAEQKEAIGLFEGLGFFAIATFPHHVVDLTFQPHDLVVMSKTLIPVEQLSPDAWKKPEEVDEGGSG